MKQRKFDKRFIIHFVIWILLAVTALVTMPDISSIVRDKGQISLPSDVQSKIAESIRKENDTSENSVDIIAVFNSNQKLSDTQNDKIAEKIAELKTDKTAYHISSIMSATDNEETAKQVVSKDETTQIAMITLNEKTDLNQKVKKIEKELSISGIDTYITGADVLNDEFNRTTEEGIKKTEIIAAVFIFFVLIVVFRSPIVPVLSLSTVGISLVVSLNIIMNLADHFDFPISNFTQVFLVVVLFGIGTDYNILLYDHFKEELSKDQDLAVATNIARKKAGKTILYSGVSVLIGFAVLAFAKFSFYQSAVGVAIGVAVLLVNLLTLNPFFMRNLGKKMFWPSKKFEGTTQSKLWTKLSKTAIARPLITLLLIGILAIPFGLTYNQTLNYNNADEVPDSNSAKQGYLTIQEHFSKGTTAPTTLYVKSDRSLDNQEDLAVIDQLTDYLSKEKGVKLVTSVTRPSGDKIDELYLKNQLQTLTKGLDDSISGLQTIADGLADANSQLQNTNLDAQMASVQQLADGSEAVASGADQLSSGISQYTDGVGSLSSGINQLDQGTNSLSNGVGQITSGSNELTEKVNSLQSQIDALNNLFPQLQSIITQVPGINDLLAQQNIDVSTASELTIYYDQLNSGISQLNGALSQINEQMPTLTDSTNALANAGNQLANSGETLQSSASELSNGTSQVNDGIQQMNSQMQGLSEQVSALSSGLASAKDGLGTIKKGMTSIESYLSELQESYIGEEFYIPKSGLTDENLKQSFDTYLSTNRKVATFTIILKNDPSTLASANNLKQITADVKAKLKNTSLADAKIAFGGQTSETSDLEKLSSGDFFRTALIMLIGIGIALIFITRSVILPLSIIGTLLIAYLGSLGITSWLSDSIIQKDLLTWNTPFFTFIMLIALGVDYSIFLMMRYREERAQNKTQNEAILNASTVIGVVVLSAAVILGGTFAALIPSGVTTLIQVALAVIAGLVLLVVLLPLTLSAVISLSSKNN